MRNTIRQIIKEQIDLGFHTKEGHKYNKDIDKIVQIKEQIKKLVTDDDDQALEIANFIANQKKSGLITNDFIVMN